MYKLQKHGAEENSPFSNDKGEKPCQFAKPKKPPCLPSLQTDATGVRATDPASDVVVPHEGGSGLGSPSAVETGGAPRAAIEETVGNGAITQESSEVELSSLPSVETDVAPGAGSAEPLANGVVSRESSEVELGGLPIVETDATCSDAGACATDPAPEVVMPHEGGDGSVELPFF